MVGAFYNFGNIELPLDSTVLPLDIVYIFILESWSLYTKHSRRSFVRFSFLKLRWVPSYAYIDRKALCGARKYTVFGFTLKVWQIKLISAEISIEVKLNLGDFFCKNFKKLIFPDFLAHFLADFLAEFSWFLSWYLSWFLLSWFYSII